MSTLTLPFTHPARLPFPLPKATARGWRDSFNADAIGTVPAGWATEGSASTALATSALGLHATGTQASNSALLAPASWANMQCECCVRTTSNASSGSWIAAAVRAASNGPAYAIMVFPGITATTQIFKFTTVGTGTALAGTSKSPAIGVWIILRIACMGATITASATWEGGAVALSTTDTSYTSGAPGLVAATATNGFAGDFAWMRAMML